MVYLNTDLTTSAVVSEVAGNSLLQGIQNRYTWASLEPAKDQYDFSAIKRDLDILRGVGKRLVVQIMTKSFNDEDIYVPAYIQSTAYGGGLFKMTTGGYNLTLWDPAVSDRLSALVNAMGKALNADNALEAVVLSETSVGSAASPAPAGYDQGKFIDNLLLVDSALRQAFPNTVVIQYTNFPRKALGKITSHLQNNGIGLGGPDVYLADLGLAFGVYRYYPKLASIVPLAPAVQSKDYTARAYQGSFDPPPVSDLYNFARNKLKANYIFWLRRTSSNTDPINYWQQVLDMMASPAFPKDPAGGLASTCPTSYSSCIE
ncbi:MAG: hypothetical protein ACRERU_19765 [Methylococcales bacterium]